MLPVASCATVDLSCRFELIIIMVKKTAEKSSGGMAARTSSSEFSENNLRQNFRLGDITWVRHGASSWWPAQETFVGSSTLGRLKYFNLRSPHSDNSLPKKKVPQVERVKKVIDEASVSSKPKKKTVHDALVRLYGTCQYLYVDPWKSSMEFKTILKEENKTAMEAFHKVLQKELTHFKSPSGHDEEPVSTKAKTSVKKVRKRSGHGGVKELATTQGSGAESEHQPLDNGHSIGKASIEDSAEGLRAKTQKNASAGRDNKGHKTASSRKEGTHREIKECGRSIKRVGNGLGADSSNVVKRPRKGRAANLETEDCQNSSPSRDSAMVGSEQRARSRLCRSWVWLLHQDLRSRD